MALTHGAQQSLGGFVDKMLPLAKPQIVVLERAGRSFMSPGKEPTILIRLTAGLQDRIAQLARLVRDQRLNHVVMPLATLDHAWSAHHVYSAESYTFHRAAGYYGTLAHELTHWTGAAQRLDRFSRFNDRKAYAFEELVAEIGNCMLCAQLGLEPAFDQSAAYVEGWLKALKEDNRAIFRAASKAQKAVDYIMARATQLDRMAAE